MTDPGENSAGIACLRQTPRDPSVALLPQDDKEKMLPEDDKGGALA